MLEDTFALSWSLNLVFVKDTPRCCCCFKSTFPISMCFRLCMRWQRSTFQKINVRVDILHWRDLSTTKLQWCCCFQISLWFCLWTLIFHKINVRVRFGKVPTLEIWVRWSTTRFLIGMNWDAYYFMIDFVPQSFSFSFSFVSQESVISVWYCVKWAHCEVLIFL